MLTLAYQASRYRLEYGWALGQAVTRGLVDFGMAVHGARYGVRVAVLRGAGDSSRRNLLVILSMALKVLRFYSEELVAGRAAASMYEDGGAAIRISLHSEGERGSVRTNAARISLHNRS